MNKELSFKTFISCLAVISGIVLASIYGLHGLLNDTSSNLTWSTQGPITNQPASFKLEVNNPDDELLVFDKSLLVTGQTSPMSAVVISSDDQDAAFQASPQGDFSQIISLSPGLNHVYISAFDNSGNQKTINRLIYYSEDKL